MRDDVCLSMESDILSVNTLQKADIGVFHLHLGQNFHKLTWLHACQCLTDVIQSRRPGRNLNTRWQAWKDRVRIMDSWVVPTSMPLLTGFRGSGCPSIDEFSSHSSFAFKKRIGICEINSERASAHICVV
jgi:hypothetical protein